MKQTQQSFNSTLKNNGAKMKRTALKAKSKTRAAKERIYFGIVAQLKDGCRKDDDTFRSELPPFNQAQVIYSGGNPIPITETHHILGREGALYLDPFNMIELLPQEHDDFTNERGVSKNFTKAQLLALVEPIRIKQGFVKTPEPQYCLSERQKKPC